MMHSFMRRHWEWLSTSIHMYQGVYKKDLKCTSSPMIPSFFLRVQRARKKSNDEVRCWRRLPDAEWRQWDATSSAFGSPSQMDDRPNKRPLAGHLTLNGQVLRRPISLPCTGHTPLRPRRILTLAPSEGPRTPPASGRRHPTESSSASGRDVMARVSVLTLVGWGYSTTGADHRLAWGQVDKHPWHDMVGDGFPAVE